MKLKPLLTGIVVAAVAVSSATAAPPAGKGKPPTTGPGCKPRITVVLKGTLATTPGANATSLSVNVTSANHWGQAYTKKTVAVGVDSSTMVRRQGAKTLGSLVSGDRVLVQARTCKADLANNATPALMASRVIAHAATAGNGNAESND
jgi:hypothetical protein